MSALQPITADALSGCPGLRHGFFTREGGVSEGIYAGLNGGFGSAEDPARVAENRARIARHLGSATPSVTTVFQVHGAEAIIIDAHVSHISREALPRADAIVTTTPGLVIGVLTADCAPVLFADPEVGVAAAAHAGWRGAKAGILEATVAAMERAGAARSRIVAAVGPCITQPAYEVGPDLEAAFLADDAANAAVFAPLGCDGRAHFDLPGYVALRLGRLGLARVESVVVCTYADEARFFSFRRTTHRGESDYGRQLSAIMLL